MEWKNATGIFGSQFHTFSFMAGHFRVPSQGNTYMISYNLTTNVTDKPRQLCGHYRGNHLLIFSGVEVTLTHRH